MILGDLLDGLRNPPSAIRGDVGMPISDLATDSRKASPGNLFFALPGAHTDGARFLGDAIDRGASAVASVALPDQAARGVTYLAFPSIPRALSEIAARFHGHPSRKLHLVGVTGTNGKTTITHLLEAIWQAAGFHPGVVGTIEYRCGDRTWPAPFTTPQAHELQALLAQMLGAGATHVAIEVSSHALSLDRVRDCRWDGALFTNLTRDHLDFHSDMESYFEAKRILFDDLLPSGGKEERFVVVNRDDPYGRRIAEGVRDRLVTFGHDDRADVAPLQVERSMTGLRGDLRVGNEQLPISSRLVGDAHLENILAAVAAAWAQKIPLATIARGIEECPGVPGRMERVDGGAPFAVLVDYAHSPDALGRAVRLLRSVATGRLIVVFGCGGDRDRGKRPLMGEAAARIADVVVLTSDNPRSEDPATILRDIERGVVEAGMDATTQRAAEREEASGYLVIPDRRQAIRLALEVARPTDVVLIAGKGHETYQIVGTERLPFDDREEARRGLREVLRL